MISKDAKEVHAHLVHYTSAVFQPPGQPIYGPDHLTFDRALAQFRNPRDVRFAPPEWYKDWEHRNNQQATTTPLPAIDMRTGQLWYLGAIILEMLVGDANAANLILLMISGGNLDAVSIGSIPRLSVGGWATSPDNRALKISIVKLHNLLQIAPANRILQ